MHSRYRTYLFLTLSNGLLALGGCMGTTATAPLARDYFGRKIDFGFATGYVLKFNGGLEKHKDIFESKGGGGTGFAIAPDIVVTAGHLFHGETNPEGIIFGNGPLPAPVRTPTGIQFNIIAEEPLSGASEALDLAKLLPGGPWVHGHLLELKQREKKEGDLAIIKLEKELSDWDRHIDPTLRPEVGDIVVVGSMRGRYDDRVLKIICKPFIYRLSGSAWAALPVDPVFAESGIVEGWSGAPVKARHHSSTANDDETWYTFGYIVGGPFTVILPFPENILEYVRQDKSSRVGDTSHAE